MMAAFSFHTLSGSGKRIGAPASALGGWLPPPSSYAKSHRAGRAEPPFSPKGDDASGGFLVAEVARVFSPGGVRHEEVEVPAGQERQNRLLHFVRWKGRLVRTVVQVSHGAGGVDPFEGAEESRRPVGVALPAEGSHEDFPSGMHEQRPPRPQGFVVGVGHHESHASMGRNLLGPLPLHVSTRPGQGRRSALYRAGRIPAPRRGRRPPLVPAAHSFWPRSRQPSHSILAPCYCLERKR